MRNLDTPLPNWERSHVFTARCTAWLLMLLAFMPSELWSQISFQPPVQIATGRNPHSVVAADFDSDLKMDLAVTENGDNSVSVFRNVSSSGLLKSSNFTRVAKLPAGTYPLKLVTADFDGDSKPDLAVVVSGAAWTQGSIYVYRNTGSLGIISFGLPLVLKAGTNPSGLLAYDFDLDGKPDLVAANINSGNLTFYRNIRSSGTPFMSSFRQMPAIATGGYPNSIAGGDLDGDGKPELVASCQGAGQNFIHIFKNVGSGEILNFKEVVRFSPGDTPQDVWVTDMDKDGLADIAVANSVTRNVVLFKNVTSHNSIQLSGPIQFPLINNGNQLIVSDLDKDGKVDVISTAPGAKEPWGTSIAVFRGRFSGRSINQSSLAAPVYVQTGSNTHGLVAADFNGDGWLDIAAANYLSNTVTILQNQIRIGSGAEEDNLPQDRNARPLNVVLQSSTNHVYLLDPITLSWGCTPPPGIQPKMLEHRFKVDAPGDWLKGIKFALNKWTDWTAGSRGSVTLKNFYLEGDYTFSVVCRDKLSGYESPVAKTSFNVTWRRPETTAEPFQIDWARIAAAPNDRERYRILAAEFKAQYDVWFQKWEYEYRKLKETSSGKELLEIAARAVIDKFVVDPLRDKSVELWLTQTIAKKATRELHKEVFKRVFQAEQLYKIIKTGALDVILILDNIATNRAALMTAACYLVWQICERQSSGV